MRPAGAGLTYHARSFLEGCLQWDKKDRFTPDQALQVRGGSVQGDGAESGCDSTSGSQKLPSLRQAAATDAPRAKLPTTRSPAWRAWGRQAV
eukprot:768454-Hanusia_phi.AAC.2